MLSIRLQGPSCEFKIINIKNKDNVYYIECKPHKNCRNSYLHDESLYNFPDINGYKAGGFISVRSDI